MNIRKISLLILLGVLFLTQNIQAQYFGRNKPRYEKFDFSVYQTPNFEIYHYLKDTAALQELAKWSEHWYMLHQEVFDDTIVKKNPVIFYNNHADFQQTNAISGRVGVGTGGVTEAFKNRVVMPIAMSKQQTHHVLGHEMVHAFQYNLILNGDSTSLSNLAKIPLWMVEGLAEYMSIGREDAHTSMWMRDAVLQGDVPTLDDLNNPKYFPYRYGQVFWAFVTGLQGDDVIRPFFEATAKYGLDQACLRVLGMSKENLSTIWVQAIKSQYGQYVDGKKEMRYGRKLISKENSGRLNIAPSLSPNGRYLIFLSEKNLFTTDLFLANAGNGEIVRQVASKARSGHIDDFDFIESAGTWSPDSRKFAFVAFSKGRNILVVKEAMTGKTLESFPVEGLRAFRNPAWSPDGENILLSGMVDGQVDLYKLDLRTKTARQLTDDPYAEMHPQWSADGTQVVYSTDYRSVEQGPKSGKWTFNLAILDVDSGEIEQLDLFPGADNLNPVFAPDGSIYFLSNRDGFRDLYHYVPAEGKVYQKTDFLTGISGITHYAPALTINRNERVTYLAFSHYFENGYQIFKARAQDLDTILVDPQAVDMSAAMLPRVNRRAPDIVDQNLDELNTGLQTSQVEGTEKPYRPQFKLDYVGGGGGVGVGTGNYIGPTTGAYGGVDLLFSDILGNNQLYTGLALNGEFTDFGGVVSYINRKNPIAWGVSYSHIPYRSGSYGYAGDSTFQFQDFEIPTARFILDNIRIFEDKIGAFAQYPFSTTLRLEAGGAYSFYYNRLDRENFYYDAFGNLVAYDRERLDPEDVGLNIFQGQVASVNAALVGDNSYFGIASPLRGHRFRLGVEKYFNGLGGENSFGGFDFFNVTADYRKYAYVKPVSFAFRGMHVGRYGRDSETLFPFFVGYPWLVRGYDFSHASEILPDNGANVEQLLGSKMLVTNFEVRMPLTGPERLSAIKSKFLFTELAVFADGGVAFTEFSDFSTKDPEGGTKKMEALPVFSVGASVRINLFGAMVLEPYYAIPLQQETKGRFGLNIVPGW